MTIKRYPACAEQALGQLNPFESALQAQMLLYLGARLGLAAERQHVSGRDETAEALLDSAMACVCAAGQTLVDADLMALA